MAKTKELTSREVALNLLEVLSLPYDEDDCQQVIHALEAARDQRMPEATLSEEAALAWNRIADSHGDLLDDMELIRQEAEKQGRFEAYDKARELVGSSSHACHVIEAQMQQEFPDRAFVPSTQMRLGSRMDGADLRMPKTPNQLREEGRVEMREKCAQVADPGDWEDWMDVDDEAAAQHKGATQIMNAIRALPTSSEDQI